MSDEAEFEALEAVLSNEPNHLSTTVTECSHSITSFEKGILECVECGLELKSSIIGGSKLYSSRDGRSIADGDRCRAPKTRQKNVGDEIRNFGYDESIVQKSEEIFSIAVEGHIYREDKRSSIILASVLEAHKQLGIDVTPAAILLRIPVKKITFGMKIVEIAMQRNDTSRKRVSYTTPLTMIREILSKWKTDAETIEEVSKLYNSIEGKSTSFNRSRVQSVAAAVVYYYARLTKRENIKLKEFASFVKISEATIQKLAKEISSIRNTPEVIKFSK